MVGVVWTLTYYLIASNGAIPSFRVFVFTAAIGAVVGTFSALASYPVCHSLLNRFFSKQKNLWLYRWSIGPVTGLVQGIVLEFTHRSWFSKLADNQVLMVVFASIVVSLIAGVANQVMANWYIRERRKVEREEQALNKGSHPDLEDNEPEVILEATLEPGGQQAIGDKGSHPDLEDNEPEVIEATLEPD
jgi:hypothetical protein